MNEKENVNEKFTGNNNTNQKLKRNERQLFGVFEAQNIEIESVSSEIAPQELGITEEYSHILLKPYVWAGHSVLKGSSHFFLDCQ